MHAESTGMLPVTSIANFPTQYYVTIQNNTSPNMANSFAHDRCAQLSAPPLQLDQRFWCCN